MQETCHRQIFCIRWYFVRSARLLGGPEISYILFREVLL